MIPLVTLLAILAIGIGAAWAQVAAPARATADLTFLLNYAWIAAWAGIGGLVSFSQKVKAGKARWMNVAELIGELAISMFVGLITGLLCEAVDFNPALTYALVGITGHMGGRAIFWAEAAAQKWVEQRLGIGGAETPKE